MGILKCLIRYNQQTDDHLGKKKQKTKATKIFSDFYHKQFKDHKDPYGNKYSF